MKKNILTHPNSIWSIINLLFGFLLWRKLILMEDAYVSIIDTISSFILGFVILNSFLSVISIKEKEPIIGYTFNALTIYLLILIYIQVYWNNF